MLGLLFALAVADEAPRSLSLAFVGDDPARMREEMAQERRLLNAKISEADAAKKQVSSLQQELQQVQQELQRERVRDGAQLQQLNTGLASEKQRDGNLTELLRQERSHEETQVSHLQQQLKEEEEQAAKQTATLKSQVSQDGAQAAASQASNEARLSKIREALKDAMAVPITQPSPSSHDQPAAAPPQQALLARNGTMMTVEDTVEATKQDAAKAMQHQDRVMNWAFRKMKSEDQQLHAMNVSKAAVETRMGVLEHELHVSETANEELHAKLDDQADTLKQVKGAAAVAATEATAMLTSAEQRVQKVHDFAAAAEAAADAPATQGAPQPAVAA